MLVEMLAHAHRPPLSLTPALAAAVLLVAGLQNLGYDPCISLSTEDWEGFTHHGLLLNDDQTMDKAGFELAMRFQVCRHAASGAYLFRGGASLESVFDR
jgi:hypothetical protein